MSDGGDGFGMVLSDLLGATPQRVWTCDAAHRRRVARWWFHEGSKTGIIETANIVGLARLPPNRYHPFDLDTFGLGKVMAAAAARGCHRLLIGLGGSATNDGGFGMARALGWKFVTRQGAPITQWTESYKATQAHDPRQFSAKAAVLNLREMEIIAAVDVQNRLLGNRGATRIYGPQKGLKPSDFSIAERCLRRLALLAAGPRGTNLANLPGAGAAGGLGFGLAAFAGGRLVPGFELFAREVRLDERMKAADVVVTGEGGIDASTFMGKGAGQIVRRAGQLGIPCVALAGTVDRSCTGEHHFAILKGLTELTTFAQARSKPRAWLGRAAAEMAANLRTALAADHAHRQG
jgi:glycerate kinase